MSELATYHVYNASAGSGKTFTLVKEYLKIILQHQDNYHFQKILAITFTNKAATEMKERILSSLGCFAKGENTPMLTAIHQETGIDLNIIQNKSKIVLESILQNYAAFHITTIDSFTHKIIRSFAYDFGLSLDFDVELDVKDLLQEAVEGVIDKIGIDADLTEALINFSLQKSDEDKTWDITGTLTDFASLLVNETDKKEFQKIAHHSFNEYKVLQKDIQKQLKIIEKQLQEIGEKALRILQENELDISIFNYKMLPNFFNALSQNKDVFKTIKEGKLAKRFEENTLVNKSASEIQLANFENNYHFFYESYLAIEQLYSKFILLGLFKESIIPLAVLSYIHRELETLKIERNIRLITEFNELIFEKIQDEPAPFIFERLGEKFQHFFIDEMQDTSELQWKNLAKLIENPLHQEGGSLLLVGDAKQAIYRWRGGASEQFIKLANPDNNKPFYIDKQVKYLDTNFRSFSEIIDFNNRFFKHISKYLENDTYSKLYQKGNNQKTNDKKGGYIEISFVNMKEDTMAKELLIPDKILQTLQNLDKEFQWKDVCIIVRKHKDAVQVANYLNEHHIPIISSETLLLANNVKVHFLINLLQIIHQPNDKQSRLDLLYYLHETSINSIDKHRFFSELVYLNETEFFKKLNQYQYDFNTGVFHQKSLYDAIEYSIRVFKLHNEPNAYLQYFLDTVLEFQLQKGSSISEFLSYWELHKEKLSISIPEGKNAVQIMTIHKSKGLQFPIVIFPYDLDIYRQINPKVWYPLEHPENYRDFKNLLIPYRATLQFTDSTGEQLFQERREILELDNYNLLYVALTRAITQLYIITPHQTTEKTHLYSGLFIDYLKAKGEWDETRFTYHFGTKQKTINATQEKANCEKNHSINTEAQVFISTDISEHQVVLYNKSSLLWDTEQGDAIAYGNLIHEILSHIKTREDILSTVSLYNNKGIINKNQKDEIIGVLKNVVDHPELNLYFQHNLTVYNEREILTEDKRIIILDRLVVYPNNQAVIIDYKTGAKEKKHHKQLKDYQMNIEKMGYTVIKNLLVYIGENTIDIVAVS